MFWLPSTGSAASHDQELNPLGLEVIDPCLKVGLNPIPQGPGIMAKSPPASRNASLAVVIVQEPVGVADRCSHSGRRCADRSPVDSREDRFPRKATRDPAGPDRASELMPAPERNSEKKRDRTRSVSPCARTPDVQVPERKEDRDAANGRNATRQPLTTS